MKKQSMPRLAKPKPRKSRSRKIIFLLFLFFIILLAVLFFRSDLSKVDSIEIGGNRYTSSEVVGQALGIAKGDAFFSVTSGKLRERVEELPFVKQATVSKSFPGVIKVDIEEFIEVAYTLGLDGSMNATLSN